MAVVGRGHRGSHCRDRLGQNPPDDKPAPPAPGAVRASPLPAPVGHRQPRASDIPPPPPGDTSRATEPRDDIDERLRICRGC